MQKEKRTRNYFLTLHNTKNEHYNDLKNYLESIKEDTKLDKYAFIEHEPEEEDKQKHIHLILMFTNDKSFKQIQTLFKDSHIEQCEDKIQSIKYLLHLGLENKKQYKINEITTNDINYIEWVIKETFKEKFNSNEIMNDIRKNHLLSLIDFYDKYGAQIKEYTYLIKELIKEYKEIKNEYENN